MLSTSTECWEYASARCPKGYGTKWFLGKVRKTHRIAWAMQHGEWPAPTTHIHHECGNKSCYRPDHLRAIPAFEHNSGHNTRDVKPSSKLKSEDVEAILRRYEVGEFMSDLAREYGVTHGAVSFALKGRTSVDGRTRRRRGAEHHHCRQNPAYLEKIGAA